MVLNVKYVIHVERGSLIKRKLDDSFDNRTTEDERKSYGKKSGARNRNEKFRLRYQCQPSIFNFFDFVKYQSSKISIFLFRFRQSIFEFFRFSYQFETSITDDFFSFAFRFYNVRSSAISTLYTNSMHLS